MQVAILAGGKATRLGDLTFNRPKSLVLIEGKPFVDYQLKLLKNVGIKDVVICTGHLGAQIEDYVGNGDRFGLNIKYSHEVTPLGTAGALKNASCALQDVFLTLYGDSFLFLDIEAINSFFTSRSKMALMTVLKNYDQYDKSNTLVEGEIVAKYSKDEQVPGMVHVDYGASMFHKQVLDLIPDDGLYSLEDLFSGLAKRGELLAFEVVKRFYEIGSKKGIMEFTQFVKNEGLYLG